MKRHASAEWKGTLQQGSGTLTSESGALKAQAYSFRSRFADGTETNPEELIASAHAGCFSMALSGKLGAAGLTPDWIRTQATLDFEKLDEGFTVTGIHLQTTAQTRVLLREQFAQAAQDAKATCPISRLLSNIKITLDAKLEAN